MSEIFKLYDELFDKPRKVLNIDPNRIDEFCGQQKFKTLFKAHLNESLKKKRSFPHTLIYGNPGLGKTSLGRKMSDVLSSRFFEFSAVSLTVGDIHKLIDTVEEHDIIFIDEIHALKPKCQEELYTPIQDFKFNGFDIPKFTLIGSTTDSGLLKKPLRDRFKIEYTFLPYSKDELEEIASTYLDTIGYKGDKGYATEEIIKRSFGTPRLIKKYADHIVAFHSANINVDSTFISLDIDTNGLTRGHRLIIAWLRHVKKPIGIDQLAQATSLSKSDIMTVYEPDLISLGLLTRSIRGRELTNLGKNYR